MQERGGGGIFSIFGGRLVLSPDGKSIEKKVLFEWQILVLGLA